jgi:hypothetical protein
MLSEDLSPEAPPSEPSEPPEQAASASATAAIPATSMRRRISIISLDVVLTRLASSSTRGCRVCLSGRPL